MRNLQPAGQRDTATDSARGARAEEDLRLLARVRGRDCKAFEQLYRNYQPRLARFLMNLLRRPHLVEEVLDDTMMVMWNRPESFAGRSALSTWLFSVAYRKAMKALRQECEPVQADGAEAVAGDGRSPEQSADTLLLKEALLTAIAKLSPDHRAVVDLTYFHEIGYREIAEIMDCPIETVKTRMFYARRHLKRELPGEFGDWI